MVYYAGVDLGATNVRAVVAEADGTTVGASRRSTPRGPTGIDVTEGVLRTLRDAPVARPMSIPSGSQPPGSARSVRSISRRER